MVSMDLDTYYSNLPVAVFRGEPDYLDIAPFNPHIQYSEYSLGETSSKPNPAYEGVRACLRMLELDTAHYGTSSWNPLGDIIKPGDKVVIKPNFVLSSHREGGNLFSIITHPSVLRAVVDYVYKALGGEGKIVIADAPQMDCDFQELLEETGLTSLRELYRDRLRFDIEILDLRDFWLDSQMGDEAAYASRRHELPADPLGSAVVDLAEESAFWGMNNWRKFYGADYDRGETTRHHHDNIHEYMISRTVLSADVLISVPKLKVHKKVGITLNAKGLVGINTNKNYLVHYTLGTPSEGGDQFPDGILASREKILVKAQRFFFDLLLSRRNRVLDHVYASVVYLYRLFLKPFIGSVPERKRILDGGNWYGNDSTWRMVVDLMKIAVYADKEGILKETPQRRIFSIVDGIIGGENNGPLSPDEKKAGVVIGGFNPLVVDIVGTRLMGFDWQKLKWIRRLIDLNFVVDLSKLQVNSNVPQFTAMFETQDPLLDFMPPVGWKGYVELSGNDKG